MHCDANEFLVVKALNLVEKDIYWAGAYPGRNYRVSTGSRAPSLRMSREEKQQVWMDKELVGASQESDVWSIIVYAVSVVFFLVTPYRHGVSGFHHREHTSLSRNAINLSRMMQYELTRIFAVAAAGDLKLSGSDLRRSGFNPQKLPAVMLHRVGTMPNPNLV